MERIERERKFLIPKSKEKEFIKKAKKKCGIIQWYLDKQTRIRLEVWKEPTGYRHIWTKTRKFKDGSPNRHEEEVSLAPEEVNIKMLNNKPVVAKIRYFLKKSHPEVIVDRFLRGNSDKDLLCEIELSEGDSEDLFKKAIKEFSLGTTNEVTGNPEYENENLAKLENIKISNFIEFIENCLREKTVVVVFQGRSLFSNISKCNDGEQLYNGKGEVTEETFEQIPKNFVYAPKNGKKVKLWKYFQKGNSFDYSELKGISAELDSLFLISKLGYDIEKVVMFVFPDNDKDFSLGNYPAIYPFLERLTENAFGFPVEYMPINYSPKHKEEYSCTFIKIWENLENITKESKTQHKEVVVDVAPGQKYPGIMGAFYCIFNNMPFFYKFEFSDEIIKFPPIPVNWDFSSIDEMLAGFKSIMQPGSSDNIPYNRYSLLPQLFKNIFMPEGENYTSVLPLNEIFDKYAQARKMPFGYGEEFFKLISSNPNDPRIKYLRHKITTQWSLQWIGDQIPETVEHSQRHSKRLMEFTVNLVNALGQEEFLKNVPEELTTEFYFVLAIAMNVHDLGHTKLSYKMADKELVLDGLPSVVRDLHNELTYQMLQEEEVYHLLEPEEEYEDWIEKETWERIKKAVKLVSRYHRGHMPIDKESLPSKRKKFMDVFSLNPATLEEEVDKAFGNDQNWKKLTIVAARWLKFIDGVDVQADRTVDPAYRKIRIRRTAYEIKNLIENFLADYSEYTEVTGHLKEIHTLVSDILNNKNTDGSIGIKIEKIAKEIESNFFYPKLKEAFKSNEKHIVIPQWLRLLNRIAFKALQFPHFEKHNLIRYVYPKFFRKYSVCGNFDRTLYLSLSVNKDEITDTNRASKVLEGVKNDIVNEFKKAGLDGKEFPIRLIEMEEKYE